MNKPRVFIAHYRGHDYSFAKEKYGEIEIITRGHLDYKRFDQLKYRIIKELVKLKSDPDDYVILDGTNLVSALVCLCWFELHTRIKLLSWDKTKDDYNVLKVSRDNITEIFRQVEIELGEANAEKEPSD